MHPKSKNGATQRCLTNYWRAKEFAWSCGGEAWYKWKHEIHTTKQRKRLSVTWRVYRNEKEQEVCLPPDEKSRKAPTAQTKLVILSLCDSIGEVRFAAEQVWANAEVGHVTIKRPPWLQQHGDLLKENEQSLGKFLRLAQT